MRILTKSYDNTVLTETQQQEIRLLATVGSILSYTSDINQCNKARKRNWSLGLKGYLGIVVHINNVLDYLGRSHRSIQVLLRGKDIQRQKQREIRKLQALVFDRERILHPQTWDTCWSGKESNSLLELPETKPSEQIPVYWQLFNIALWRHKWDKILYI